MVQKYQNEIPPIFYYGISTKTSEKDLKIPNLQALTLGRIIKMTLYERTKEAAPATSMLYLSLASCLSSMMGMQGKMQASSMYRHPLLPRLSAFW